jgi:hypothetical protein
MTSSRKRTACCERLRQLEQLGLLLSFEHQLPGHQPSEVEIEQCAIELECPVMDLPDGQTLFVVWVSLWAERPGVRLYDFRFEPPWRDHAFRRLPNFADSHIGEYYRLPGGLEYPRAEVLNLNFLKEGWRLPSTRVEGALCALSATPIPQEYRHGASIPVGLKFFGKSGQQLAGASVALWADRWREPAVIGPSATLSVAADVAEPSDAELSPRSSLYEGPPPALTVCERSRAEYIRTRRPCGFRMTWGERGNTLSDGPVTFGAGSPDPQDRAVAAVAPGRSVRSRG